MLSRLGWILLALPLTGCSDSGTADTVLDAVVITSDAVFDAIDAEDSTWLISVEDGAEVNGSIQNAFGGSLAATGWRVANQHETENGFHISFAEKLFVSVTNWSANDITLTGQYVITRHSHDFGPPMGDIEDANRTTTYVGTVEVTGDLAGLYDLDIHAQATGSTLWTCGTINDDEIGFGACY